jgi:serine/threonine protein kinase
MAPEQITQPAVTTQADLFSLGVVMYEMLAGKHPFYADTVPAVTHRIVNEMQVPIAQSRAGTPDILEFIVRKLLKKSPEDRYKTGLDVASDLSSVFEHLTLSEQDISDREKFNLVRDLKFFVNFSEPEIWEVINASTWAEFQPGETVIHEGQLDNSFYILVSGNAIVRKGEVDVYTLTRGECFGEIGFITREKRTASVVANSSVWVMRIRPSLIENASAVCQLRFHKEFLSTLANRLKITTEKVI